MRRSLFWQSTFEANNFVFKRFILLQLLLFSNSRRAITLYLTPYQSINQFYFIFVQISIHRNKLHSSGQKKETMAKRYTLIHAHE